MQSTTETRTIRGKEREVGAPFFHGPDFYASLVDGDDDFVIVRDEITGEESLFEWVVSDRPYYVEDVVQRRTGGRWVFKGEYR